MPLSNVHLLEPAPIHKYLYELSLYVLESVVD